MCTCTNADAFCMTFDPNNQVLRGRDHVLKKMATSTAAPAASGGDYPLRVEYCGVCTMPPEESTDILFMQYCEYSPDPAKCYEWMKVHLPAHYARLVEGASEQLEGLSVSDKRQTRGGKARKKVKVKEPDVRQVRVSRALRSKKKCVTVVVGLKTFDIELKKASKAFAQHYSCGSSVTGEDEVVIQGDVCEEVIDFIQEKWPEVDDDSIDFVGDHKR